MMDLHVHTLHSDGACSVEEVLREAQCKNLACLAICDHDTMDAWRDLADIGACVWICLPMALMNRCWRMRGC